MGRKPHNHQDPHTNELRACTDGGCKLPFRTPAPKLSHSKPRRSKGHYASREEQQSRYIDCGPTAWDDR